MSKVIPGDSVYGTSATKDQFKVEGLSGSYYTLTNKETGLITIKRKGPFGEITHQTIGTIDRDTKKFTSANTGTHSGPSTLEAEIFSSPEGTNTARQSAMTVTTKALVGDGSYRDAVKTSNKLFITNRSGAEENTAIAAATAATFFGGTKGTREAFPKNLTFPPEIRNNGQDVIKFNMLKYEPKKYWAGGEKSFSAGERSSNRKIIGSVILPIPAGIGDANAVGWGPNEMNPAQMAAAGIALDMLGGKKGEGEGAIDSTIDALGAQTPAVKQALKSAFAGAATGTNQNALLGRTTGQILNPNMELLFNSPALRPFNFTFLLSPRSSVEAKEIVKVLRFFKQGMAPIRTESNLFLKSPHTFKMQYLHRGNNDHKFLNKFKECALQAFNVNYTPNNNYSTYKDGSMQSYQITMTFTELEPVFNDQYPSDGDASVGY